MRTLKLDQEIEKTQNKINSLQYKNFEIGLSRKDTFELNRLNHKLKHLSLIEMSDRKYIPKEDEKIIKQDFLTQRW